MVRLSPRAAPPRNSACCFNSGISVNWLVRSASYFSPSSKRSDKLFVVALDGCLPTRSSSYVQVHRSRLTSEESMGSACWLVCSLLLMARRCSLLLYWHFSLSIRRQAGSSGVARRAEGTTEKNKGTTRGPIEVFSVQKSLCSFHRKRERATGSTERCAVIPLRNWKRSVVVVVVVVVFVIDGRLLATERGKSGAV